jgi:hypothetical protein
MRMSTTFEVSAAPERVAAYLADPRHLVVANHPRPVIERSAGPQAAGSWFVLALDQIRVRVEYTVFDPPVKIAAQTSTTGRLSGNMQGSQEFVLTPLAGARGTRVHATVEGEGGWLRWAPVLLRASRSLYWRRMRLRMEESA